MLEYEFPESTVGVTRIGENYVRFMYDAGTVTAQSEDETLILERLRARGICRYPGQA